MSARIPLTTAALVPALSAAAHGTTWPRRLERVTEGTATLHVAVLVEPYLSYLLEGRKTIESRFSKRRTTPYGVLAPGDVLALKAQSGPVVGLASVAGVSFHALDARSRSEIRREFGRALCAEDEAFWSQRQSANFATLARVGHPSAIEPFALDKTDRRGWVALKAEPQRLAV